MAQAGLRERKKARTRADLQRHALRLFRDRGWAATTVDDIAAAAEVSRSTFFRYFPTKEDVVLFDDVDPLFVDVFATLPTGTPVLAALRETVRRTFAELEPEKRELEEVRMELARQVPEIGAALRERDVWGVEPTSRLIATIIGRDADDLDVMILAGVFSGARLTAQARVQARPDLSYPDVLDEVLGRLADGVPLADAPIRHPTA